MVRPLAKFLTIFIHVYFINNMAYSLCIHNQYNQYYIFLVIIKILQV